MDRNGAPELRLTTQGGEPKRKRQSECFRVIVLGVYSSSTIPRHSSCCPVRQTLNDPPLVNEGKRLFLARLLNPPHLYLSCLTTPDAAVHDVEVAMVDCGHLQLHHTACHPGTPISSTLMNLPRVISVHTDWYARSTKNAAFGPA